MNGKLIGRKVDCCIIHYPNGNIPEEIDGEEWGSIRSCSVPTINYVEEFKERDFKLNNKWKDYKINDSDDWERIKTILVEKRGLLLQADAGNGKTYCAKKICKCLSNVKCLAPTNKAALNIRGSTIHKFLGLDETGNISKKKLETIQKTYKYIVVDEISMINKDMWKRLVLLKQSTDIIFLLIGDENSFLPLRMKILKIILIIQQFII